MHGCRLSIVACSDLTDFGVIVPDFLRQTTQLVFGFDIATVSLAMLVEDDEARTELERAERALSESHVSDSLSASAMSFDAVVSNYERRASQHDQSYESPFQPSSDHRSWFRHYVIRHRSSGLHAQVPAMDKLTEELDREFESVWKALEGLQDALRIVLLGLDFRRYVRFRRLTPHVYHVLAEPSRRLAGSLDGSPDDAQFCIDFVVESALRLQSFDV
jgi:hypothetical protein